MIVLIKKIINNLPMLTGIFEPSMTPPTSDKYINCDILSAPITKRVISFCTPSINIEGRVVRNNGSNSTNTHHYRQNNKPHINDCF